MLLTVVMGGLRFLAAEGKFMNFKPLVVMLVLTGVFSAGVTWARTDEMKKRCDTCHTMHNSQGGNLNINGIGVQGALLGSTCYGCHTGVNGAVAGLHTPYIFSTGKPNYGDPGFETGTEPLHDTLAGGSFWWVGQGSANDLKGHNVNIPGVTVGFPALSCAGVNGCHGDLSRDNETAAMSQSHHAPTSQYKSGSTLASSYRFLNGIAGYEDQDYELTLTSSDHNQYKGNATNPTDTTTLDSFCVRCHSGVLHGPWNGHPSSYDLGGVAHASDYGTQGGNPAGTYNIEIPLGSTDVSAPKGTVTLGAPVGDAIVVCISCHRAHGSPYDNNLRWDYKNVIPGSADDLCLVCHNNL